MQGRQTLVYCFHHLLLLADLNFVSLYICEGKKRDVGA